MSVMCCRCGYQAPHQVVDHVVAEHETLLDYLQVFGGEDIVSYDLKTALENLEIAGVESDTAGINEIADIDRHVLVSHWARHQTPRSVIEVVPGPYPF